MPRNNRKRDEHTYDVPTQLFRDMVNRSPLSRAEERELSDRIAAGDTEARNELALANMRFAASMARQWHQANTHIPYSEFLSAAHFGLMEAASRFDGTRGFKFISYAVWWIRRGFFGLFAEFGGSVRIPASQQDRLRKILGALGSDDPDALGELGLSERQVQNTLAGRLCSTHLDAVVEIEHTRDEQNWSDAIRLGETLSYEDDPLPDDELFELERISIMARLLWKLDYRRRVAFILYNDAEDRGELTHEEIGKLMGVSCQSIRHYRLKAESILREPRFRTLFASIL